MEIDEFLMLQQTERTSRRRFLKLAGAAGLGLASAGTLLTLIQPSSGKPQLTGPLNWYASGTQYSKPELLKPWVDSTNVEVVQSPWTGADEMAAKMRGGGTKLFDTLSAPQQWLKLFAKEGLIEPTDPANVPNLAKVFPQFAENPLMKFDGKQWGVPWVWGANAIAYNKNQIPTVNSMSVLFDEKNKGRISMRDDPEDSLAVAALYLGIKKPYEMDDAALSEVKKLLVKQKPLIRTYWKALADLQTLFANGEVWVAWAQLAILQPLRQAGINMGWVWPKEGALGFFNGECVVKGTSKKYTAEAFSDYLVGADYGVLLGEHTGYYTTSQLSIDKMSSTLKTKLNLDPSRLSILTFKELFARPKWQRIWNEVKAS